jgi:hypothetical protein
MQGFQDLFRAAVLVEVIMDQGNPHAASSSRIPRQ